jgi:hypothetical protein
LKIKKTSKSAVVFATIVAGLSICSCKSPQKKESETHIENSNTDFDPRKFNSSDLKNYKPIDFTHMDTASQMYKFLAPRDSFLRGLIKWYYLDTLGRKISEVVFRNFAATGQYDIITEGFNIKLSPQKERLKDQ